MEKDLVSAGVSFRDSDGLFHRSFGRHELHLIFQNFEKSKLHRNFKNSRIFYGLVY